MHSNYAMMSPSDISLVEDEGVERDGVEREGGATKSVCCDLNCALLCLTIVASMAHTLSLHDALPISRRSLGHDSQIL